eukprot:TRINITY_DN290_c2_g1_i1.p1 TRINITY_DN290_c2_g1~~TRINITY_DN290_c2_g1_i1.p1  ORF type:complete len:1250 (+),score=307.78 TRINITY_DN290_c2_g1_i1:1626-5375(+)
MLSRKEIYQRETEKCNKKWASVIKLDRLFKDVRYFSLPYLFTRLFRAEPKFLLGKDRWAIVMKDVLKLDLSSQGNHETRQKRLDNLALLRDLTHLYMFLLPDGQVKVDARHLVCMFRIVSRPFDGTRDHLLSFFGIFASVDGVMSLPKIDTKPYKGSKFQQERWKATLLKRKDEVESRIEEERRQFEAKEVEMEELVHLDLETRKKKREENVFDLLSGLLAAQNEFLSEDEDDDKNENDNNNNEIENQECTHESCPNDDENNDMTNDENKNDKNNEEGEEDEVDTPPKPYVQREDENGMVSPWLPGGLVMDPLVAIPPDEMTEFLPCCCGLGHDILDISRKFSEGLTGRITRSNLNDVFCLCLGDNRQRNEILTRVSEAFDTLSITERLNKKGISIQGFKRLLDSPSLKELLEPSIVNVDGVDKPNRYLTKLESSIYPPQLKRFIYISRKEKEAQIRMHYFLLRWRQCEARGVLAQWMTFVNRRIFLRKLVIRRSLEFRKDNMMRAFLSLGRHAVQAVCAVDIQRVWRGYHYARKNLVFVRAKLDSCIKVQTWWRCYSEVMHWKRLKALRTAKAIDIQRVWRGHWGRLLAQKRLVAYCRREWNKMQKIREEMRIARRIAASIKIQTCWRGVLGRRKADLRREEWIKEKLEEQRLAAEAREMARQAEITRVRVARRYHDNLIQVDLDYKEEIRRNREFASAKTVIRLRRFRQYKQQVLDREEKLKDDQKREILKVKREEESKRLSKEHELMLYYEKWLEEEPFASADETTKWKQAKKRIKNEARIIVKESEHATSYELAEKQVQEVYIREQIDSALVELHKDYLRQIKRIKSEQVYILANLQKNEKALDEKCKMGLVVDLQRLWRGYLSRCGSRALLMERMIRCFDAPECKWYYYDKINGNILTKRPFLIYRDLEKTMLTENIWHAVNEPPGFRHFIHPVSGELSWTQPPKTELCPRCNDMLATVKCMDCGPMCKGCFAKEHTSIEMSAHAWEVYSGADGTDENENKDSLNMPFENGEAENVPTAMGDVNYQDQISTGLYEAMEGNDDSTDQNGVWGDMGSQTARFVPRIELNQANNINSSQGPQSMKWSDDYPDEEEEDHYTQQQQQQFYSNNNNNNNNMNQYPTPQVPTLPPVVNYSSNPDGVYDSNHQQQLQDNGVASSAITLSYSIDTGRVHLPPIVNTENQHESGDNNYGWGYDDDDDPIAENVCVECLKEAEVFCNQCQDAYCLSCFGTQHRKGNRRKHVFVSL